MTLETPARSDAVRTAVIFDLDYTVTCIDTYPLFLLKVLKRQPSRWLRAGFLPLDLVCCRFGFRDNQWLKERALTVIAAGTDPLLLDRCSREVVDRIVGSKLRPGAITALEAHRAAGCHLILATASFDFYAQLLADRLGFHTIVSTQAERDHRGRLTGRIAGKNCYGEEKVRRIAATFPGVRKQWHVIAYTDHHSDLPLLEWAESPRVVNPSAKMRRISQERGYPTLDW